MWVEVEWGWGCMLFFLRYKVFLVFGLEVVWLIVMVSVYVIWLLGVNIYKFYKIIIDVNYFWIGIYSK